MCFFLINIEICGAHDVCWHQDGIKLKPRHDNFLPLSCRFLSDSLGSFPVNSFGTPEGLKRKFRRFDDDFVGKKVVVVVVGQRGFFFDISMVYAAFGLR